MKLPVVVGIFMVIIMGYSSFASELKTINIDGEDIIYGLSGYGGVPVIFESGLGNGVESWEPIYENISALTKTFVYARPGYNGRPDDGNPKTASFVVQNLRKTLKAIKIKEPVILVGHSLGGMYMEFFAKNYPQEVAGLILVDSRHHTFSSICMEKFGPSKCLPPKDIFETFPQFMKNEFNALPTIEEEIRNSAPFSDYPIVVLSGAKGMDPNDKLLNKLWISTQKEFIHEKPDIVHKISAKAGHYIHHQDPELVVETIAKMIKIKH